MFRDIFNIFRPYEWWQLLIEWFLIGFVVYWVIRFLRGTRGARLLKGILGSFSDIKKQLAGSNDQAVKASGEEKVNGKTTRVYEVTVKAGGPLGTWHSSSCLLAITLLSSLLRGTPSTPIN